MKRERIILMTMLFLLQSYSGLKSQPVHQEDIETSSKQDVSRDIDSILQSLSGPSADGSYNLMVNGPPTETIRLSTNSQGYLRVLGAPALYHFPVSGVIPGDAQANAKSFFSEHKTAFGIANPRASLTTYKADTTEDHSLVRLKQTYLDIPVFGAEILVQLTHDGHVEYVSSDIMTDTKRFDSGTIPFTPSIAGTEAEHIAIDIIGRDYPELKWQAEPATLMIYQPSVVGNVGSPRLVWSTEVTSLPEPVVAEIILIDTQDGDIALRYSVTPSLDRRVAYMNRYDQAGFHGIWARKEGEPEYGKVPEVDKLYDYLGDTYDFYFNLHGRKSIDNKDMPIIAYLFDVPNVSVQASWNRDHMRLGLPYVTDDVVAHEYTHGITQYESGLIYLNESGAINESFSDMWAEWIDQTYHHTDDPNDSDDVKWLIGEDVNRLALGGRRAIRNMKDPTEFGQPDRKSSLYWHNWLANPKPDYYENDWGGVHINAGVGNKLAYLLTDGGSVEDYKIEPMGILKAAELFYEVQTRLLTPAADYYDLYSALTQAAINLIGRKPNEWTNDDLQNVERACRAVEIDSPSEVEDEQKEYPCSDLPVVLRDNGTTSSTIHIENVGAIVDLNVKLDISHTRDQDLDVFLIAPDGTRIELFTDIGGTGDDFKGTVIDDDAILSITEGLPPFTGSYRSEQQSLLSFYGTDITGIWTLEITDDSIQEIGTLNSWSLDIVSLTNTVFAFIENFPSRQIDSTKWTVTQGTPVIVNRYTKTIPAYSLKLSGGDDAIESRAIDLSSYSRVILSYSYLRTGWNWETQRWGESPDRGDDLIIESWDDTSSSWIQLESQPGDGPDMYSYSSSSVLLPKEMLKAKLVLRIRTVGNKGDWFIDDIMIKGQY